MACVLKLWSTQSPKNQLQAIVLLTDAVLPSGKQQSQQPPQQAAAGRHLLQLILGYWW
jgi:hypothetical protein